MAACRFLGRQAQSRCHDAHQRKMNNPSRDPKTAIKDKFRHPKSSHNRHSNELQMNAPTKEDTRPVHPSFSFRNANACTTTLQSPAIYSLQQPCTHPFHSEMQMNALTKQDTRPVHSSMSYCIVSECTHQARNKTLTIRTVHPSFSR